MAPKKTKPTKAPKTAAKTMGTGSDTIPAPGTPEKFTETILNAIASGATKVEVFSQGKKIWIRIDWE